MMDGMGSVGLDDGTGEVHTDVSDLNRPATMTVIAMMRMMMP